MANAKTIRRGLVDPGSPSAEPFRTLRLALQLRAGSSSQEAVLITSAEPGAGKTVTASNFALVSALAHTSVLLIDADIRRPAQHEIFGLARSPGLVELLAVGGSLSSLVQSGPAGLKVLTAGREVARTSEISSSPRMADLLAEATSAYDVVVIDSPPVLLAADVEGMASLGNVQIVFVADRSSRQRAVVKALRRLDLIECNIAGIVLNREGHQEAYGY